MDNCKPWDSAAYEADRAARIARGHDLNRRGPDDDSHVRAYRAAPGYRVRPFRFEDLNGAPEPEKWGPLYPTGGSAAVEKWRKASRGRDLAAFETRAYGAAVGAWIRGLNAPKKAPNTLSTASNCASGQWGDFSAAKHRAKLKAEFAADAARDRKAWALGKLEDSNGRTIGMRYEMAMAEKRHREMVRRVGLEAVRAALFGAVEFAEAA
jgi:hypothetical protein